MKFSSVMITVSLVVGLVAVFLAADVCKPYRDQIRKNVPPNVRQTMDFASIKIKTTLDSLFGTVKTSSHSTKSRSGTRIFTKEELKQYDGSDEKKPVYLALLGSVFDVTRGKRHYGKGGGYSFFSGRDGSRAFVTGKFDDEGLVDDVEGLSNKEIFDLQEWISFYEKDYTYVGVVVGNFYDKDGKPTAALNKVGESVAAAKLEKELEDDDNKRFPPCNSEWSSAAGSRVWCSDKSGGIDRDWIGVPRIYKKSGLGSTRCACIRTFGAPSDGSNPEGNTGDLDDPHFKIYEGCDPELPSCKIKT